ncbi:16S rRNA (guanine(966)-N(2))-methyltransferase RsmD [Psychrobacter aquimaris]|uniref:16S rRNA (guanine(966)-N(2))-methyltransferase RsmD n=1 Tax=Psychrobacter aquimaris TaxID=292733 RepID=UPI0018E01D59|nr:16S rRNA (guanine(966)-N(2))-methyltransferase RsmD [Psychrobacter aquimaris]
MKKSTSSREPKNSHKTKNSAAGDVRIIGGQFKRRVVRFIDAEGLRPTPDRLRETLFNWLLADIHGAYVLDSCAGSGVLGFEALSRGAAHATFIEINPAQSNMLRQSAEQLHLSTDTYQIIQGTAEKVLMQEQIVPRPFNIVFIDPPYAQDLWQPILMALITQSLIDNETLIYLEADKDLVPQLKQLAAVLNEKSTIQPTIDFECLKQTKVGQVVAGLYRLSSS